MEEKLQKIVITDIITAGVETRSALRPHVVEEYATMIREGVQFDPAVVFRDPDGKLWLAAGHHRKAAYVQVGEPRMQCRVKQGLQWDAIEFGIRDNLQHRGERLTIEDKRHNVRRVLQEQPGMSDSAIARLCQVSPTTVGKYREQTTATIQNGKSSERIGQDGRVYDTSNIGRKPVATTPAAEELSQDPATSTLPRQEEAQPVAGTQVAKAPPVARMFREAQEKLGLLHKHIDGLGDAKPGPQYLRISSLLDAAGSSLTKWQSEPVAAPVPAAEEEEQAEWTA